MILLDSDHLTVLKYRGSERYVRLTERLQAAADDVVGTTIVNVEEQMRGWLASLAKERAVLRQVTAYRELAMLFEFFSKLHVAPFNALGQFLERAGFPKIPGGRSDGFSLHLGSIGIKDGERLIVGGEEVQS